jgi:hypothetical protein
MYEHSNKISGFHMPACFLFLLRAIGKQNSKHFASAVLKMERFERLGNKNPENFRQISLCRAEVNFLDFSPSWEKAQIGELSFLPCLLSYSFLCLAT